MVNIGIVGLGFIGKTHLEAFQKMDNCVVKAVCKRNINVSDQTLHGFQGYMTTDFNELLADDNIDVIDICLPTFLHEAYILKAAAAKKHIICEKPLTLTVESAERIMIAVNENHVELYVGQVLRFWPEYQLIKSFYDKKEAIELVHAQRLGQFPNWGDWFKYPEKSGGALYDLHIHDIDFLVYLLGKVETVYSTGIKNDEDAWIHVMTTLTFKTKTKAFVEASNRMPNEYPFTITYRSQTKDYAIELSIKAEENIDSIAHENNYFVMYAEGEKQFLNTKDNDAFYNELFYFIACIAENKQNHIISLPDVVYTLKVLEAIEQSLNTGEVVQL